MPIKPIDIEKLTGKAENIYEAIVIGSRGGDLAKRSAGAADKKEAPAVE